MRFGAQNAPHVYTCTNILLFSNERFDLYFFNKRSKGLKIYVHRFVDLIKSLNNFEHNCVYIYIFIYLHVI